MQRGFEVLPGRSAHGWSPGHGTPDRLRTGPRWVLLLVTLAALLAACAVPTEVADPVPGRTARDEPAVVPPRSDVVSAGEKVWQTNLPLRDGDTYRIEVEGAWYAATLLHRDGSLTSVIGDSRDGTIAAEWRLTGVSGWPLMVADGRRTGLLTFERPGKSARQVLVFRGADGRTFELGAGLFDAGKQGVLKVEAAEGGLAVVRRAGTDRSRYGPADLLVVDTREAELLWEADVTPRRIDVDFGMITADYHSGGDPQLPSDRVRTWDLATGDVLVDMALDHSNANPPLPCSVSAGTDRLLFCGLDDAEKGVARLVSRDGRLIAERRITGRPALDSDAGIVALTTEAGLEALDLTTGQVDWAWDREESAGTDVKYGRDGLLLGARDTDNLVIDSRTGQILLVEPFFRMPEPQWNGKVVLRMGSSGVNAWRGPGPLLGYTASDESLIFLSR